jgi:hypothetical protein
MKLIFIFKNGEDKTVSEKEYDLSIIPEIPDIKDKVYTGEYSGIVNGRVFDYVSNEVFIYVYV